MAKGKDLSVGDKKIIMNLHEKGFKASKIAEITNFKVKTVYDVIRRVKALGSVSKKPRKGRPRITTPRIDRFISGMVRDNRMLSATKVQKAVLEQFELSLGRKTVVRRLHEAGHRGYRPAKRPLLTKKHMKTRLDWAKKHSDFSQEQWSKVLWSDESKFCIFGNNHVQSVWRKPGERFKANCVVKTVKHGGGNF